MYKEPELTEQEILDNFKNKHEFDISGINIKVLEALVRYSRLIGYNEGFKDKKKKKWSIVDAI